MNYCRHVALRDVDDGGRKMICSSRLFCATRYSSSLLEPVHDSCSSQGTVSDDTVKETIIVRLFIRFFFW